MKKVTLKDRSHVIDTIEIDGEIKNIYPETFKINYSHKYSNISAMNMALKNYYGPNSCWPKSSEYIISVEDI